MLCVLNGWEDWCRLDSSQGTLSHYPPMRFLLTTVISLLLLTTPLFGQSEKPQTIIVPTGSLGDISETRKKILEKTLESKLDDYFSIVPKDLFEEAQEQAFQEMESDECTEEQCIMMIREILQVENSFQLVLIVDEGDTQISLTWNDLDQKRVEEDFCEGCKTKQLRLMIEGLVEKLVGMKGVVKEKTPKKVEPVVVEKPEEMDESQGGIFYQKYKNGSWIWVRSGDEKHDAKYVGETITGVPNGKGTLTFPLGSKYVGQFKDGKQNGQGVYTSIDERKLEGEWKNNKPWNITEYDQNGKITRRYVNGVKQK